MSTKSEVEAAIARLSLTTTELDDQARNRIPDRSVSVHLLDLDTAYEGLLSGGQLINVQETSPESAKDATFLLTTSSADFIALIDGDLGFGPAWASGRLRIDAGWRDLLELRKFL